MKTRLLIAICTGIAGFAVGCNDAHDNSRSESTVRGPSGEKLSIEKPHHHDMRRGETERVIINLHRHDFSGPVRVVFSQLPSGVEAVDMPRSTDTDQMEVILRAGDNADMVSNQEVMVTAEGPEGIRASVGFTLTVRDRK